VSGSWQEERAARARQAPVSGVGAERRALAALMLKGWWPLARRYGGKGGEIDLICRRGRTIIFVEVKARASLALAADAVTADKIRLMRRRIASWRAANPWATGYTLRVDAVLVMPRRWPRHLVGLFDLDDG
jgi:putative endonuclease